MSIKSFILKLMPDSIYLRWIFKKIMGYPLNLKNPRTFNEKLQWLKLHDRKPIYTTMVDKYEAKKYAASIIGEEYIIPTLGVWNHFDEIDFDSLPNQFVLKCTHDSGGIVICRDKSKFDKDTAREKIEKCLKFNFYWAGREWPYKNVKPRIIAEKYMEDESYTLYLRSDTKFDGLIDYKFMCFNGKVKCIFTVTQRYSEEGLKVTFFDTDWNKMPFERHYPMDKRSIKKPTSYDEMVVLSEKLSRGCTFVRVDFYEINEKPYFGEMTFYPGDGWEEFTPYEWDRILGEWIDLGDQCGEENNNCKNG